MDIKIAAQETEKLIKKCYTLSKNNPEIGRIHLHEMTQKIITGEVSGEKAYRYLGWIQACICFGGGATLEDMKSINRKA